VARGYTTRKLEVWSISAHLGGHAADYLAMFKAIAALDSSQRQYDDGERVVALRTVQISEGKVYLVALEGPHGQPIIFDTADSSEETAALRPSQVVATRTHALVDLSSREVLIEYNHRGAKAFDIAAVLGVAGRRAPKWSKLYVEISPKVDLTFAQSIRQFERIKSAGVRIGRPNYNWTDWAEELSDAADDSDAQTADIEFTAGRGETLSKTKGIISFIKARAAEKAASMKNAYVVGRRPGDDSDTKVTLNDHKEHHRVGVKLDQSQNVNEKDIWRKLEAYDETRSRGPDVE
jgi:hypothetical protein